MYVYLHAVVSASALVVPKRSRIHVPSVKLLRLPPKFPGEDLQTLLKSII